MFEKIKITNKKGLKLSAVLGVPDKNGLYPTVICLHGFTGYKDEEHIIKLCEFLTKKGYITFRFDCSGFGESEGTTENDYRLTNYYSDIESVFEYLKSLEFVDTEKLGIWGNSLGATLAICFASKNPLLKAICVVSAPTGFARNDNFERRTKAWKETGYFEKVSSKYGHLKIPYDFVADAEKWNSLDSIQDIKIPILFIVGKEDVNVFPANSREIFDKANERKEWIEIDGMNHFYKKNPGQIEKVNEIVGDFFDDNLKKF